MLNAVNAKNALWSALDAVANPVSSLVTLAVLVRTLSASDYGILVIAMAVSGLSLAINPAIAATTTKFVSEVIGHRNPDRQGVAGVITVALTTVAAIDLALIIATATLKAPLTHWLFDGALVRTQQIGIVLLLAVVAMAVQQIDTVLAAAIRGLECFRLQAMIEMLSKATLAGALIYVAWHTRSVEAILITQSMVYIASAILRAAALRQLLPQKRLCERPHWDEAIKLYRYGGWMSLVAIAGAVYTSADRIIVGRSLGSAAAGQYNIYVQITQLIHFIPSSLFAFSFPIFSRLAARDSYRSSEISSAYKSYLFGICITALTVSVALALSWHPLLRIFSNGMPYVEQGALPVLLGTNFLILAVSVAPYYLLLAVGRSKAVSLISSGCMLAALMLMVFLVPRYGLSGAALARLTYGIGALAMLQAAHRTMKQI